jgi:large subunit ribosomal protein L21
MFAVIKTGGKQYKVAENDVIKVEKLAGKAGDKITLDQVLMLDDDKDVKVGTPILSGKFVTAEILEQGKADKIIVFKKNRRKNYRRTQGHRQEQTVLRITSLGGAKKPASKVEAKIAKAEKPKTKKTPFKKAAPAKAKVEVKKAAPKKAAPKPKEKK